VDQLRLNPVTIRDPAVNGIEGATLLVPDGWALEGGFFWMPLFSMQANLLIRVTDPGTGASVESLPAQQFCWPMQPMPGPVQPGSNWMGSVMLPPPRDAAEFVQTCYLPGPLPHLQSAQLVRVEDLPRYAAEVARAAPPQMTVRAQRLRYAYQAQGRAWEEDVYATLTYDRPNGYTAMWWCNAHAMRAPDGALDRMTPMLSVPIQSVRLTLDWSAMVEHVRGLFRRGLRQEQADLQRLGQQWAQHREQIRQMHRQLWEERQASLERQHFAFREVLGGVETYSHPFEARTVELPAGYANQWANAHGQIILTNDPTFDPNVGNTVEYRPMGRYTP
jgi:hypothetical protein